MTRRKRNRTRGARSSVFRSMDWLRVGGLGARLHGFVLLFVFAIGSILARDVVLYQQVLAIRAAASIESGDDAAIAPGVARSSKSKARPSGISKRAAWSPFDPPDDDDETDQDSDSLVAHRVLATLPSTPRVLIGSAVLVERATITVAFVTHVSTIVDRLLPPRGPPAAA